MKTKPPTGSSLVSDWIGRKVKTNTVIENGLMKIPKGTICRVTYARGGLSLETDPCQCCGVQVKIRKVNTLFVDEVVQVESC